MELDSAPLAVELGSEVLGLDLARDLDDGSIAAIRRLLVARSVLVFRAQDLSPARQLAFTRRFGGPEEHVLRGFSLPGYPQVFVVSNLTHRGRPRGSIRAGQFWHTDCSYMPCPTMASLLHARQVPSRGGDTLFASLFAAYEALPEALRKTLDGLRAIHDYSVVYETYFSRFPDRPPLTDSEKATLAPVSQPVVRVHPDSGRKALFISPGFTRCIVGMHESESCELLTFLAEHLARPEFVYRHRWQVGDLVMWDNRSTAHQAMADYDMSEPRHMHRTSVAGDRPLSAGEAPA